jgi:hypothetical protein
MEVSQEVARCLVPAEGPQWPLGQGPGQISKKQRPVLLQDLFWRLPALVSTPPGLGYPQRVAVCQPEPPSAACQGGSVSLSSDLDSVQQSSPTGLGWAEVEPTWV